MGARSGAPAATVPAPGRAVSPPTTAGRVATVQPMAPDVVDDGQRTEEPEPAALVPSGPAHVRAFGILNASTAPLWLAMILFPRSRATAWLVGRADLLLAGLGVTYTALLASELARGGERPDLSDPDALRRALTGPTAFLVGWTHYLAFDLFVGRWIWQQNVAEGRSARLPLLLTWWAGPAGLTVELARRRRRR